MTGEHGGVREGWGLHGCRHGRGGGLSGTLPTKNCTATVQTVSAKLSNTVVTSALCRWLMAWRLKHGHIRCRNGETRVYAHACGLPRHRWWTLAALVHCIGAGGPDKQCCRGPAEGGRCLSSSTGVSADVINERRMIVLCTCFRKLHQVGSVPGGHLPSQTSHLGRTRASRCPLHR